MYKYLPTAALIVGVVLLGVLGSQRQAALDPTPTPPVPVDAPAADDAAKRPPSASPKRRVIRFERGPSEPSAPVTSVVIAADPPSPPPPGRRTLDELSESELQTVRSVAMERLAELVEACQDTIDDPVQSLASIVLDDRGLHTMELAAYEGAPGEAVVLLETPPPQGLADCLEDELWAGDWAAMKPGESVAFELSMRFEQDAEAEPGGE